MRKGSQSFTGFAPFALFGIVGFVLITGTPMGLLALLGVFFTMQFCNSLDRRSIREGRPR